MLYGQASHGLHRADLWEAHYSNCKISIMISPTYLPSSINLSGRQPDLLLSVGLKFIRTLHFFLQHLLGHLQHLLGHSIPVQYKHRNNNKLSLVLHSPSTRFHLFEPLLVIHYFYSPTWHHFKVWKLFCSFFCLMKHTRSLLPWIPGHWLWKLLLYLIAIH